MKTATFTTLIICQFVLNTFSQDLSKPVSQVPTPTYDYHFNNDILKLGLSFYEYKNYKDIKGSPYCNPELLEGRIVTVDGKILVGKLRYNIYTDEIEFEYKNNLLSIAKPDNFKEFYIDKQKLKYISYVEGKKIKKSFMIIQEEGEYTLMIKKTVEFFSRDKQQPYSEPRPDRFELREDKYYLSFQNQPAHRITSIRKLLKAFPELKELVVIYPEKKIDFGNKEDLKKLVEFFNTKPPRK
jgi:hypothetical protein